MAKGGVMMAKGVVMMAEGGSDDGGKNYKNNTFFK